MKYYFCILLAILLSICSCRFTNDNKIFKTNVPLSSVLFFTLHIGEGEYIMRVPDGYVSTGKVEKKGIYYVLTDELSNEIMYAKIKDDFFIFLNGRYKDLIIAEDKITENYKDFEAEELRLFLIKNEKIIRYREGLFSQPGSSFITLPAEVEFCNRNNLRLQLFNDSYFGYSYSNLLIETGEYSINGNEIILTGHTNQEIRFDLSDKEEAIINSLPQSVFKVYIIDSNTVNLGTLPFASINNIAKIVDTAMFQGLYHDELITVNL